MKIQEVIVSIDHVVNEKLNELTTEVNQIGGKVDKFVNAVATGLSIGESSIRF